MCCSYDTEIAEILSGPRMTKLCVPVLAWQVNIATSNKTALTKSWQWDMSNLNSTVPPHVPMPLKVLIADLSSKVALAWTCELAQFPDHLLWNRIHERAVAHTWVILSKILGTCLVTCFVTYLLKCLVTCYKLWNKFPNTSPSAAINTSPKQWTTQNQCLSLV